MSRSGWALFLTSAYNGKIWNDIIVSDLRMKSQDLDGIIFLTSAYNVKILD